MARRLRNWVATLLFGSRCAACHASDSRVLCDACFKTIELGRDLGSSVYLLEDSPAADALTSDPRGNELLCELIILRLDQLGWEVSSCICHGMDRIAPTLREKLDLNGKEPTLAIGCAGSRVTLTLVESAPQRGEAHLVL
jgi:hypothetical protein